MSWDAYVSNICSSGRVDKAAIIGLNGSVWTPCGANKQVLNVNSNEACELAAAMKSKNKEQIEQTLAGKGITIDGTKYMFLRCLDEKTVCGKKAGCGQVVLESSKQAVVVGHIPEEKVSEAGAANADVDRIASYLESTGY